MLSERQQQIIEESIKLIDRNGIQGFTIKNLSKAIGISEPGIYRHFESKFVILSTILDLFSKSIAENLDVLRKKQEKPAEKLRLFSGKIFEILTANPALVTVIFSEEIFQNEKELSEKVNDIQTSSEKIVAEFLKEYQSTKKMSGKFNIDSYILMYFGSIRLLAKKWKKSGYSFSLKEKGEELTISLINIIK